MSRRLLLPVAFLLTTFGLLVLVTGGFVTTIFGVRVSSRSPLPAVILAGTSMLAWWVAARRSHAAISDLEAAHGWLTRHTTAVVFGVGALAAGVAIVFHSFSAIGADASGYLSYTTTLLDGALMRTEPLAALAAWSDGPATLAPLGWRAAIEPGFQVPTYAIGLPLLMTPFHLVGGAVAASVVVPLTLAVAVAMTGLLARRIAGTTAAMVAGVWLATSPVALIESMQVMSDVPVTAAWMLCWWLAFTSRPLAAGGVAGLAALIRPNLAPLAILPALYFGVTARDVFPGSSRWVACVKFSSPVAFAGALVAYLQWRYFGSPVRSGYGTAEEIYALSNVAPNATLYARWLIETHGPWLFAAPFGLVALFARRARSEMRELSWLFGFGASVIAGYLIYAVFETWTYLRFLLPAMAIAMIAVASLIAVLLARAPLAIRVPGLALVVLAVAFINIASAREHGVFRFADHQARARVVGEHLASLLPVNAVIVSGEQSGAMRYYTGRSIVRWDLIDSAAMRDALDALRLNGYEIWVVLDDWEEDGFRRKFPRLASASMDVAPLVESARGVGMRTRGWRARLVEP